MPHTEQVQYSVLTLQRWLLQYDNDLVDVVRALCDIFELPDPNAAYAFLNEEIDRQGHLLIFGEPVPGSHEPKIVAVAGWRWPKSMGWMTVYLGVRSDNHDPYLRAELVGLVFARLGQERETSRHYEVRDIMFQYSPIDPQLGQACLDFGFKPHPLRNTTFRERLKVRWTLASMSRRLTLKP